MKKTKRYLSKAAVCVAALFVFSGGSVLASAEGMESSALEMVRLENVSEVKRIFLGETAAEKKVLPPKKSKSKAEQDYKTKTLGTVQYQVPEASEEYDAESGRMYVYEDPALNLSVNLSVSQLQNYNFGSASLRRERLQETYAQLLENAESGERFELLSENENFPGLLYQVKEKDITVTYITLYGNDSLVQFTSVSNQYGREAAAEYQEKMISAVKKVKEDTRKIIKKKPELSEVQMFGQSWVQDWAGEDL